MKLMLALHDQENFYPFPDSIFMQNRPSAKQDGNHVFEQGVIEGRLVIWVDASVGKYPRTRKAKRLAVAALRYLDLSTKMWIELVALETIPPGYPFALEAETIAVREAFRVACGLNYDFDRLLVFTDCMSLLKGIRSQSTFDFFSNPKLLESLYKYANTLLEHGIVAELHWVPAHSLVEGNELVDELAVRTRQYAQFILATERPDLILHGLTVDPSSSQDLRQLLLSIECKAGKSIRMQMAQVA